MINLGVLLIHPHHLNKAFSFKGSLRVLAEVCGQFGLFWVILTIVSPHLKFEVERMCVLGTTTLFLIC